MHGDDSQRRKEDFSSTSLVSPAHVDEILKHGLIGGATGRRAAFQTAREHYPEIELKELWRRFRKLKDGSEREPYQRAQWSPEDIEILCQGYARGPAGARWAVGELLKRHPDWTRRTIHYKAYALGLTRSRPQRRGANGKGVLVWSQDAESALEQDHGSEWAQEIAKKLGRTESAVRSKLWRQERSSKFRDGLTRDAVVSELHTSPRRLQWLIGTGQLGAVQAFIRSESLKQFLQQNTAAEIFHNGVLLGVMGRTPQDALTNIKRAERRAELRKAVARGTVSGGKPTYTIRQVARIMEVSRKVVKTLVATGRLKLTGVRIDEEALREYVETHRSEINCALMDEDLSEFYGLDRPDGHPVDNMPGRVKHTLITRTCPGCQRSFSGNGYLTHVKVCPQATQLDASVLKWAAEHPTVGTVTEKTKKAWWKRRKKWAIPSHGSTSDGSAT